jgi:hypothetical protein
MAHLYSPLFIDSVNGTIDAGCGQLFRSRGRHRAALRGFRAFLSLFLLIVFCTATYAQSNPPAERWSEAEAQDWYAHQPWLVGSNYIPANAINQLEMWQSASFDPQEIDRELGWAESIGMNTMRVFLHDLLWQQDQAGFTRRIDQFLAIAAKHHIRPVFVLFDSCWDPFPNLGLQHPPVPGVHNSGWVQSPGANALGDEKQYPRLKEYVQGVIGAFANDPRVLAWDLWNEPDNMNEGSYGKVEFKNKAAVIVQLLPQVFEWAREKHPSQPLTSGVWQGDWSGREPLSPMARIQLEQSDVITFHNYGWPEDFAKRVSDLERFRRPIICTEYMARGVGSLTDTILPIAQHSKVGAINWGFVAGKTQTYLPWDSWQRPYVGLVPPVWFHDLFHPDGSLYRPGEGELIRRLTAGNIVFP